MNPAASAFATPTHERARCVTKRKGPAPEAGRKRGYKCRSEDGGYARLVHRSSDPRVLPGLREDDEHAELLVADEAMLGPGGHKDGLALLELHRLPFDLEHAAPFEDDVDLVVLVGLLTVGLGRDQHVDAKLEARRGVDDLIAARQPL